MNLRRALSASVLAPSLAFVALAASGGCTSILGGFDVGATPSEGGPVTDGGGPSPEGATDGSSGTDASSGADAACQAPGSATFDDAIKVAAGTGHSCAIRDSGTLYCWGDNSFGQLGVPQATALSSSKPLQVQFPAALGTAHITDVALGEKTTMAVDSQLRLWVFGNNEAGLRADGTRDSTPHPEPKIVNLSGATPMLVRKVGMQWFTACALTTTNDMYCWGTYQLGSLGPLGGTANTDVPVKAFSGVVAPTQQAVLSSGTGAIAACYASGISGNNALVCWGLDSGGYLLTSNGSAVAGVNYNAQGPIVAAGATLPLADVRYGTNFGAALGANGVLVTWGTNNSSGQQGATLPAAGSAQRVPGTFTSLGAGYVFFCAVDGNKHVQCRGSNSYGQLGRPIPDAGGFADPVLGPALLPDGTAAGNFISVSAGFFHTCGIVQGTCGPTGPGKVVCWGNNETGQLGSMTSATMSAAVVPVMAP